MQSLLKIYRRWVRGRGFGIHSPFAYRFVTEVLRQRLPYYGYADISGDPRIRLLFRLVVEFRPEHVSILSAHPTLLRQAVRRASNRCVISCGENVPARHADDAPSRLADAPDSLADDASDLITTPRRITPAHDFLIVDDLDVPVERYLDVLAGGRTHALILNAAGGVKDRIAAALPHGMTFDNRHGTIIVAAHSHLPRQDFDLKF